MRTILFLSANAGVSPLRLNEEAREIQQVLMRSKARDQFSFHVQQSVRLEDIQRLVLMYQPNIIHMISGDSRDEGVILEDEYGKTNLVSAEGLARLFELFADEIECVILDGCYSELQASAIAQYISYVIGVRSEMRDSASLQFMRGFYDALATGSSVAFAYKIGCNAHGLLGLPAYLTPVLITRGAVKLQGYDQALKQYEAEFSKAVQQKYPLAQATRDRLDRLLAVLGIRDVDVKAIETRVEDIEEIRRAVSNQLIQDCQRLAQAIVRRMGATDLTAIMSPLFPDNRLWEFTLPATGLQLATQTAILYLSQDIGPVFNDHIEQIAQQKTGAFLVFVSLKDICPRGITALQLVWFSPSSLMELIAVPEDEQLLWLSRFLFRQINVVTLPGMLPYKTKGVAKLFFGRENELARITSGAQKGGIIIGAHRSGKTSFLEKLKEKLQQQGCKVVGPLTFFGFQSFYKDTLEPLNKNFSTDISLEDWSSALKAYSKSEKKTRLVFLLDEVDKMIQEDLKCDSDLGHKMRSLQNEGYCEFFLAGHAKLREAIAIEGGPFRNFAEEITFTGLTKEAATDLIQSPMKLLGFEVSNAQANRIYEGTSGVAVLIQEFSLKLLDEIHSSNASDISDTLIEEVEQSPDFLDIVFSHYKYGQTWDSMAITLLTAMKGEIQRQDITQLFTAHGIIYSRDKLDKALNFLTQFGVLQKLKNGHFQVLPSYLTDAVKIDDPDSFLESEVNKGKVS